MSQDIWDSLTGFFEAHEMEMLQSLDSTAIIASILSPKNAYARHLFLAELFLHSDFKKLDAVLADERVRQKTDADKLPLLLSPEIWYFHQKYVDILRQYRARGGYYGRQPSPKKWKTFINTDQMILNRIAIQPVQQTLEEIAHPLTPEEMAFHLCLEVFTNADFDRLDALLSDPRIQKKIETYYRNNKPDHPDALELHNRYYTMIQMYRAQMG